jgi:hypothetical protein
MLVKHHVSRAPVRRAVKVTREALNHALDVAEPRLEQAAVDLEDLTRESLKALRKSSIARLDDLKGGVGKLEKRVRKQIPGRSRRRLGQLALVAAGVTVLGIFLFR